MTLNEGFSVKSDGSYRHSGILKVLDCAIRSSSSFNGNTYIGTLSADAKPRGNYAFFAYNNGKLVYVTLYGTGGIQIDTFGNNVPADTNIWIRALYV